MNPVNPNSTGKGVQTLQFLDNADDLPRFLKRFKSHLASLTKPLHNVLKEGHEDANNADKKELVYHKLVGCLGDESLDLVSAKAENDGPAAIKLLEERYLGSSADMEVDLIKRLVKLKLLENESPLQLYTRVNQIKLKLETVNPSNKNITDKIYTVMALEVLIDPKHNSFKSAINVREKWPTWVEFETLMKVESAVESNSQEGEVVLAHNDKYKGQKNKHWKKKQYCTVCDKDNHTTKRCFKRRAQERAAQMSKAAAFNSENLGSKDESTGGATYAFVCNVAVNAFQSNINSSTLLVDSGATSHIVCDPEKFISYNESYDPANHYVELADGKRTNGLIKAMGTANFKVKDEDGKDVSITVNDALLIPSYNINIFSVKKATEKGATCILSKKGSELITSTGAKLPIVCENNLYWFQTPMKKENIKACSVEGEDKSDTVVKLSDGDYTSEDWHRILGHVNHNDLLKTSDLVNGMKLTNKKKLPCETCLKAKMTQPVCKKPDARATAPFELVHTDLCGPVNIPSKEGLRYVINFVDDFTGLTNVYFLKDKTGTVEATKRYIADISKHDERDFIIKRLRSDNGTEYTSKKFEQLMIDNHIFHEHSCAYAPHQNGTAERSWRTLFDTARCLMIESMMDKSFWPHAVRTAAYIRNRCVNNRLNVTPYEAVTKKKPSLDNMHVFGSLCYAYVQEKGKLDPRGEEAIFLGYHLYSPAYVVYLPKSNTVKNVRVVKFTDKFKHSGFTDQSTQNQYGIDLQNFFPEVEEIEEATPDCDEAEDGEFEESTPTVTEDVCEDKVERRWPERDRKPPAKMKDYVHNLRVDFCYRISNIPTSYKDAISSPEGPQWKEAMAKQIEALIETESFEEVPLPDNENLIGSKWVFAVKEDHPSANPHRARVVAKGYSQVAEEDYLDTFSPTAYKTTLRTVHETAWNEDYVQEQLDFDTAFLNAPLDVDIYVKPPEGYIPKTPGSVWLMKKSLYGLKQSSKMWNNMLNKFLLENNFTRSMVDHCLYVYRQNGDHIILVIWVDDILICANNQSAMDSIKLKLKCNFKVKELGKVSNFLGIQYEFQGDCMKLHQTKFAHKILEKYDMAECKPQKTPCPLGVNKELGNDSPLLDDNTLYRGIVGSLMYLMTNTRPDLCFVVSYLSKFMVSPTFAHLQLAKRVLRYLKHTISKGLTFVKSSDRSAIIGYCDSDWGQSKDRHSISGYCFVLNKKGPAISWRCSKQKIIALSSCEAEYVALTAATQEAKFLRQLLADIQGRAINGVKLYDHNQDAIVSLYADNTGAIALAKNPVHHQRSKHIDIKYHFIRLAVEEGIVDLQYIPSNENIADQFTKPLSWVKLNDLSMINGPKV